MKYKLLLVAFFFTTCLNKKYTVQNKDEDFFKDMKINLRIIDDTVKTKYKKTLQLKFVNPYSNSITIEYPCYPINVNLKLFKNNKEQIRQKAIRASLTCVKNPIKIQPYDSAFVNLNIPLDELFLINNGENFELMSYYNGLIGKEYGQLLKRRNSLIVSKILF